MLKHLLVDIKPQNHAIVVGTVELGSTFYLAEFFSLPFSWLVGFF